MRIALDGMGSDTHPLPETAGAVMAARELGVEILLVGREDVLAPALQAQSPAGLPIRIVHAPEVLTMQDKGLSLALKAKRKEPKTSMALALDLVRRGDADAFVTAGNTGAAAATAYFRLGTLAGVERPALSGVFPTRGGPCVVLDIGANPECKAENLLQFGIMGSLYAERVLGIRSPRVGLLSNGEEAGKGSPLVKETYPLLEAAGLNFVGNVEGKELFGGAADVVVTDGFTGNVLLKSSEAVAKLLTDLIRDEIKAGPITAVGGLLARPAFARVKKVLDPSEHGAAPLLGINGLVFIGHGRSGARAIASAVRVAAQAVQGDLLGVLGQHIAARLGHAADARPVAAVGS